MFGRDQNFIFEYYSKVDKWTCWQPRWSDI